jgi:hypothetical protein
MTAAKSMKSTRKTPAKIATEVEIPVEPFVLAFETIVADPIVEEVVITQEVAAPVVEKVIIVEDNAMIVDEVAPVIEEPVAHVVEPIAELPSEKVKTEIAADETPVEETYEITEEEFDRRERMKNEYRIALL